MTTYRVIKPQTHSARHIAALTESLLHSKIPTLAFFLWPKSVSIPYEQSISDINLEMCEKEGYEVTRITGGGRAYVHGNDFSIAISKPTEKRPDLTKEMKLLCEGVSKALQELKIPAQIKHRTYQADNKEIRDGYDVEINGKKVAGYAAVWKNNVFLIHGAFVHTEPDCRKWLELMNAPPDINKNDAAKKMHSLITAITNHTDASIDELIVSLAKHITQDYHYGMWTSNEEIFAKKLQTELYTTNLWKEGNRSRGHCLYPWGDDPAGSLLGQCAEK